MIIASRERTTGRGATKFTAILNDFQFVPLSRIPSVAYHGRDNGEDVYSLDVKYADVYAEFYRSNSGHESVEIKGFTESIWAGYDVPAPVGLMSFNEAEKWAEDLGKAHKARFAPLQERAIPELAVTPNDTYDEYKEGGKFYVAELK